MTQGNTDPQPADQQTTDLQFQQAEYAAAPAAPACAMCKQPIQDMYYTLGQAAVCGNCHDAVVASELGGSRIRRFLGALVWGIGAAILGAGLWYGVRVATGYEVGLVAIVVGLLVGGGVHRGSRGRGGWFYQTLAIVLTYSCIAAQYVPDLCAALVKDYQQRHQITSAQHSAAPADSQRTTSTPGSAARTSPRAAPTTQASVEEEDEMVATSAPRHMGLGKAILVLLLAAVVLFAIAAAAPVLAGFTNIIGLLIIGFALYEAWKMNKRRPHEFAGPFALAAPAVAEAGAGQ